MFVIGIDGGGTKTSIAIFDIAGKFYGIRTYKFSSSIDTVSFEIAHVMIKQALSEFLTNITPQRPEKIKISSIFLGLGGIVTEEDSNFVENIVRSWDLCQPSTKIQAKNDIYNAHAAGLGGGSGICFIIGTGSVGFGMDDEGYVHRVGGYSYLEGDPGSSYHLGRLGLTALAKAIDHRIPFSPFLIAIQTQLQIFNYCDYVRMINSISRQETAQLAQLVTTYASSGDALALQFIDIATDEIILMFLAITRTLEIKNKEIAIIGSLGCADSPYKSMLKAKISRIDPEYSVFPSPHETVIGSVILAFKQIGNSFYLQYLKSLE